MSIEIGRFNASVKDYGISESQGGHPQVFLKFDVHFTSGVEEMTWYGSLKEGPARDISLKALLAVGFEGNDLGKLLEGTDGGAIPVGTQASVVTGENEYNGKKTIRINWVNAIGGGQAQRVDKGAGLAMLAKMNLSGDMARLRAMQPAVVPKQAEDIPF